MTRDVTYRGRVVGKFVQDGDRIRVAIADSEVRAEIERGTRASFSIGYAVPVVPPDRPTIVQLDAIASYLYAAGLQVGEFVSWPVWAVRRYTRLDEPCDMFCGPCSCGAWHRDGR